MKLTREQTNTIIKNKPESYDKYQLLEDLISDGYEIEGIDTNAAKQYIIEKTRISQETLANQQPQSEEKKGFGQRVKEDFAQGTENIKNILASDSSTFTKVAKQAAQITSMPLKVAYEMLPEFARKGLSSIGKGVGKGIEWLTDKISNNPKLQKWASELPEEEYNKLADALEGVAATGQTAGNVAVTYGLAKGAVNVGEKATELGKQAYTYGKEKAGNAYDYITKYPKKFGDKVRLDNIDPQVKTVLKKTTATDLDKYANQAKLSVNDASAKTPHELAGEKVLAAAKIMKKDISDKGITKSNLISEIKTVKAPKIVVEEINTIKSYLQKNLTDAERKLTNQYLSELKKLGTDPTIGSVDATIDKMQSLFYERGGTGAIPVTGRTQSILNSSMKKINNQLKSLVDKKIGSTAYSDLNSELTTLYGKFKVLNKALKEGGTGGSQIISKFFSKTDAGTKELFNFIKEKYGIDLSNDAVLAKFTMELFDDPRAGTLFGMPPTSKAGVVNFVVKKLAKRMVNPERMLETAKKTIPE